MPLIIPQGKQDTTQDNKFNPIVAKDVLLEITELKLATTQANTLEITLRILDGPYKNRFVFDRIQYAKTAAYDGTWKYRALRKCAGVPYDEKEPASIDIEALLLHKAVKADLGIRKGKNKDGEEGEYQDIKYKVFKSTPTPMPPAPEAPVELSQEAPAPKKTTKAKAPVQEDIPVAPMPVNAPAVEITDESDWD